MCFTQSKDQFGFYSIYTNVGLALTIYLNSYYENYIKCMLFFVIKYIEYLF